MQSQGKGKMGWEGRRESVSLLTEWQPSDETKTWYRGEGRVFSFTSESVRYSHQTTLLSQAVEFFWPFSVLHLCLYLLDCSLQNSPNTTCFSNITLLLIVPIDLSLKWLLYHLATAPPQPPSTSVPQWVELAVLWHQKQRMQYICVKLWSEYPRLIMCPRYNEQCVSWWHQPFPNNVCLASFWFFFF